ncbi:putative carboxylesterase 18 [Iris pallida]|uniref:Carboxylesterase 18 n=1 Tax=Iris pallida TaxID=29817 RepID=A0AAX6FGD7_IRIPA|nr:putative carboxylesterase 18 [Iris pallida]
MTRREFTDQFDFHSSGIHFQPPKLRRVQTASSHFLLTKSATSRTSCCASAFPGSTWNE